MSGVGGVGGAGSAAGACSGSGGAPAAAGSAGSAGGVEAASAAKSVGSDAAVDKDASSCVAPPSCAHGDNMSTQSFVEIHNSAITQVNECQNSDLDLKKLIEMMMAIQLLKAMNENK